MSAKLSVALPEYRGLLPRIRNETYNATITREAKAAVKSVAYGLYPRQGLPYGLDASNGQIWHMVHPRDSEAALVLAEHTKWAQREALKALHLATADASRASEAAGRANAAVLEALKQPGASFPVYREQSLPGEPYEVVLEEHRRPSGWYQGYSGEVSLPQLLRWFQRHPGPPHVESPHGPAAAAATAGLAAALPGGILEKASSSASPASSAGAHIPFLDSAGTYQAAAPLAPFRPRAQTQSQPVDTTATASQGPAAASLVAQRHAPPVHALALADLAAAGWQHAGCRHLGVFLGVAEVKGSKEEKDGRVAGPMRTARQGELSCFW